MRLRVKAPGVVRPYGVPGPPGIAGVPEAG